MRGKQAADTPAEIVFSSPQVWKEAGAAAPRSYNVIKQTGQGNTKPRPMKGLK